jgi:hypothetical protein
MDEETSGLPTPNNVIFGEIQVLLAEKRTALASLRTRIVVEAFVPNAWRLIETPYSFRCEQQFFCRWRSVGPD